jgi:Domain of unknown function (DUF4190)
MTQPPHAEGPGWTPPGGASEPAAQPQYGPSPQTPYVPSQYQPGKRNRFAIAALIFGIVGGVLLAIIFGIVALVQIGRRGERGRGMAITGLALSGVWVILIVAVAAVGAVFTPDRDESGHVTQKSRAFLADPQGR